MLGIILPAACSLGRGAVCFKHGRTPTLGDVAIDTQLTARSDAQNCRGCHWSHDVVLGVDRVLHESESVDDAVGVC